MKQKARLGQNFLANETAAQNIVKALGDIQDKVVLEIGPGRGAITGLLAPKAGHLILVELDRELAAQLRIQYAGQDNVTVIEESILTINLAQLLSASPHQPEDKLQVVGNLPYYITSDILLALTAHAAVIDQAVLMVQREVAERVCAAPGSRDYGVLTVTMQAYATVETLFTLPPSAFSPPPQVYSTVFRMVMAPQFSQLGVSQQELHTITRILFAQKRKTVSNNLKAADIPTEQIEAALLAAEVLPSARAETLSLPTIAKLGKILAQQE